MSKLNLNLFARDLITRSKNLTPPQQKDAQIARLYLTQCSMPVYCEGTQGKFVMLSNAFFKAKAMSESAFVTNVVHAGAKAGIKEEDILDSYLGDSNASALCNYIQEKTLEGYKAKPLTEFNAIVTNIENSMKNFRVFARDAKLSLDIIVAVEQQLKRDLDQLKKAKAQESENQTEMME